jgi:uncharacterized protein YkwD
MGIPVLMLLASMLVPVAHESWAHEMNTITRLADHVPLARRDDLDAAAQLAAELGPRPDLRHRLRSAGLVDGLVLPVVVVSPGLPEVREAWRSYVPAHILPQGVTHYGLAFRGDTLAVVFARRLFEVARLPRSPRPGGIVEVSGTLTWDLTDMKALIGRPDELVGPATVRRTGRRVWIDVPLDAGPGTYVVEVVGRSERGPEVIAMVPIHSAGAERAPTLPCLETEQAAGEAPDAQLLRLINRDRRRLGLASLKRSQALSQSAGQHASEMARTGFAAHVLPGGRPPANRLASFEVQTERFHENVAMATTVGQAHTDLWASPSHRQALLDPAVNRIGVGIQTVQTEGGPIHFIVEHLAQL